MQTLLIQWLFTNSYKNRRSILSNLGLVNGMIYHRVTVEWVFFRRAHFLEFFKIQKNICFWNLAEKLSIYTRSIFCFSNLLQEQKNVTPNNKEGLIKLNEIMEQMYPIWKEKKQQIWGNKDILKKIPSWNCLPKFLIVTSTLI